MTARRSASAAPTLPFALVLAILAGCVATAAPLPPRRAETPPLPAGVSDPPGKPPSPDAAWVPGHWHWSGTENVWVPGRWETPPGHALYGP